MTRSIRGGSASLRAELSKTNPATATLKAPAASLSCALSISLPALIAARAVQGPGAAGLMSVNSALVRLVCPKPLLGRDIAINSISVAASSVDGPSIAAAALSFASWPWVFAVNLPIRAVVLALGWRALPHNATARPASGRLAPLDVRLNVLKFGVLFLSAEAVGTRAGGRGGLMPGSLLLDSMRHDLTIEIVPERRRVDG